MLDCPVTRDRNHYYRPKISVPSKQEEGLNIKLPTMQLVSKTQTCLNLAIRLLLHILLIVIVVVLGVAIFKSARDSIRAVHESLEIILQNLLLDVVTILAVVEIATIVTSYLKDGHVHIRYIIDTVLVIMANEFVVIWFHKPWITDITSLCLIVITLAFVRVLITRYLPDD